MLRTLGQPRYLALTLLMVIVAGICVLAGSWQVARLAQKSHWNVELRANAHASAIPLDPAFIARTGDGGRPSSHRIQFHTITAMGSYLTGHDQLVREATVDNNAGYYVLTPFDTHDGILLVVRGFIAEPVASSSVPSAPIAPTGTVRITARIQPGETKNDGAADLSAQQVESINPNEQSARLGQPVYQAYAELLATSPGVGALTPIPAPDLSNPAGGAVQPQHLAYIIQWFLFALLALAAPIAMARAESRHVEPEDLSGADAQPATATAEQLRRDKMADRYGRVR